MYGKIAPLRYILTERVSLQLVKRKHAILYN